VSALIYVFREMRPLPSTWQPNQKQTEKFIELLQHAVRVEKKQLSEKRCKALDQILEYNRNPGEAKFIHIKPSVFAFQLAARVREPSPETRAAEQLRRGHEDDENDGDDPRHPVHREAWDATIHIGEENDRHPRHGPKRDLKCARAAAPRGRSGAARRRTTAA
jgi:hypothetical protein